MGTTRRPLCSIRTWAQGKGAKYGRGVANPDPVTEFRRAVERLASLERQVAAQQGIEDVTDALTQVRLAVIRAFGGQRPQRSQGQGASKRILDYLVEHLGEWVHGDELAAVSGVNAWARRVRELRLEFGFEIEEENGRYKLASHEPNEARKRRWTTVTEIREAGGTAEDRVRALLERLVAQPVSIDELDRVARSREGARIVRELRTRDGWPIQSDADSPTLSAGEYRLVSNLSAYRIPETQSLFDEDLRRQIFGRDSYTCWDCGSSEMTVNSSPVDPFYLVIKHLDAPPTDLSWLPANILTDSSRLASSCIRCMT